METFLFLLYIYIYLKVKQIQNRQMSTCFIVFHNSSQIKFYLGFGPFRSLPAEPHESFGVFLHGPFFSQGLDFPFLLWKTTETGAVRETVFPRFSSQSAAPWSETQQRIQDWNVVTINKAYQG